MSDLNTNKWHNPIARDNPVWHGHDCTGVPDGAHSLPSRQIPGEDGAGVRGVPATDFL